MLNLPKTTEFNKRIPKKKFYEQLSVSPDLKRVFVEQIKNVIWYNKIADSTVNLEKGTQVTEIEVFEVQLTEKVLDERVLRLMDQGIPYHIVFVLHCNDEIQLWSAYKRQKGKQEGNFKVEAYYHTDWIQMDSYSAEIIGINLDQVYENWLRKIAGGELDNDPEETLEESIEKAKEISALKKRIDKQQAKVRKEKQFNKRVKYNDELKRMKKELQKLENGKNEDGIA